MVRRRGTEIATTRFAKSAILVADTCGGKAIGARVARPRPDHERTALADRRIGRGAADHARLMMFVVFCFYNCSCFGCWSRRIGDETGQQGISLVFHFQNAFGEVGQSGELGTEYFFAIFFG